MRYDTVPFVIPTSTLGPGISPMFDAKTNNAKGLTRLPVQAEKKKKIKTK
jgi:hypothetical protein